MYKICRFFLLSVAVHFVLLPFLLPLKHGKVKILNISALMEHVYELDDTYHFLTHSHLFNNKDQIE